MAVESKRRKLIGSYRKAFNGGSKKLDRKRKAILRHMLPEDRQSFQEMKQWSRKMSMATASLKTASTWEGSWGEVTGLLQEWVSVVSCDDEQGSVV